MIEQIITTDLGERVSGLLQAVLILVASYLAPLSNAFTVLIVMAVAVRLLEAMTFVECGERDYEQEITEAFAML